MQRRLTPTEAAVIFFRWNKKQKSTFFKAIGANRGVFGYHYFHEDIKCNASEMLTNDLDGSKGAHDNEPRRGGGKVNDR